MVGIFIVANVVLLALALTIGMAAAVVINVPDEYTTIHDAWAKAQVAHAPSGPWSFNGTIVAPFSDQGEANFQIDDFMANFRSMRTARKPAMSTALWQQEQPQTSRASRAVVGSWGATYNVPGDYPTIQLAIDNASGGETILVEPGRYNETLDITVSNLFIKANSTNPAATVVSATGTDDHVINITNQANVTIEGFTIQDAQGTSQDVAGIYMDNTSECAVSNTVIRNISAVGSYDAYGVMMIGMTIKPRLTDTTIRTILGGNNSVGILMENARNPSFDPTLIENVTASNGTAFGILMTVTDGSFTDTTIRDIAGNSSAFGILVSPAINVTFDPTVIERITASAPDGEAYGIYMDVINGSFTDTTIRDISGNHYALGIDMYGENVRFYQTVIERVIERVVTESDFAIGIYGYYLINGSFTDTTISDIAGDYYALGIYMYFGENVSFDPTVIERVNAIYAYGIYGYYLINSSFTDTTIRDIAGDYYARGIYIYLGENVSFDPTVIERVNAPYSAYGIYGYLINGSFTDTTIRDIAGNSSASGIYIYAINVSFLTGELTNCRHGLWLEYGEDNRIEGFIIRDNTLFDTGVHLETDTSNTTVYRNCFYNNVLQAWDNGTNNSWDGNYWEPEPGEPGNPFLIPGNAGSKDNRPLSYCPLCPQKVPALTLSALQALFGLLSAVATITIATRKRR